MSTALVKHSGTSVPTSKNKLAKGYVSLKQSLARHKEKAQETIEAVVRTTEGMAAAAVVSGIQGMRAGEGKAPLKIMGKIDLELAVAAGCHVGALLGVGGKYSEHLRNFGDGAAFAFAANWARGAGYKHAKKKLEGGASLEDKVAAFDS